eukprot:CAMPEP_0179116572 /NCGR_PEP_ID=MMETSP0796-20121207/54698_1 /TAXON_ID=73915 /ORGANISM="Pyrodinium bahamense, Strain pbaha01" /LENGTH=100 /DNA_ID=CAMNT_0020814885 /DNA_START=64 /DNA_END=366 /DNA_ORIENTATION=-
MVQRNMGTLFTVALAACVAYSLLPAQQNFAGLPAAQQALLRTGAGLRATGARPSRTALAAGAEDAEDEGLGISPVVIWFGFIVLTVGGLSLLIFNNIGQP